MSDEEKKDETAALLSGESRIRVLIVTKNRALQPAVDFLLRRNYVVRVVPNAFLAIKETQTLKPHVVLLSWNSPKTNIVRMYELFAKTVKAICIVFTETSGRKASTALIGSGIPHTMMAPITGPAIHMKIQTLLRRKVGNKKQKRVRKNAPTSTPTKIEIPIDNISKLPPETNWARMDGTFANVNETMWEGSFTDKAGNTQTFHFRGAQPPAYDVAAGSWENIDLKNLSELKDDLGNLSQLFGKDEDFENDTLEESPEEDAVDPSIFDKMEQDSMEATQEEVIEEDDPLFNADDPNTHAEGRAAKVTQLKKTQNSNRLSLLAHHTKWALENIVTPADKDCGPVGKVSSVSVAVVETLHFKGYLVCSSSPSFSATELMEKTFEKLQKKMYESHEAMRKIVPILELQCQTTEFMSWAEDNAEFVITSQEGDSPLAIAYVPVEAIPEILETTKEDLIKISVESDLMGETQLFFDVYIFMEKNDKYIMYLRRGSLFTQARQDKLLNFGIQHVYLRKKELPQFHAYWASVRLFQAS